MDEDPILESLIELVAVGRANIVTWVGVMTRVEEVRELRRQGVAYRDMDLEESLLDRGDQ